MVAKPETIDADTDTMRRDVEPILREMEILAATPPATDEDKENQKRRWIELSDQLREAGQRGLDRFKFLR